ncbi:2-oxoglutarate dehydrogenase complex dihydrolipoyllysine-residue succinyltransferase [Verrucomicrobia bacterium]|nr:2-oxoglutarate dehydrogenase complex dihydrolipoyllysine-residue succinyltransferase [Verrucomicrobiota bacterium]|tara:strand:- start:1061 stop:2488 length:1428 start_codon:yes stop_codon:yes gene_type:complete
MSGDIRIPSVGESVSSGLIAQWHKNNGDSVNIGDLLLTLDTDKISTEIAADSAGNLQILVTEGEEVSIGSVVGRITSENLSHLQSGAEEKATSPQLQSDIDNENRTEMNSISSNQKQVPQENQKQDVPVEVEGIVSHQVPTQNTKRDLRLDRKAPVSPVVKRLAKENGVDLSQIIGSGKKGAILKKDVQAFIDSGGELRSSKVVENLNAQSIVSKDSGTTDLPDLNIKPVSHHDSSESKIEEGGRITRQPLSPIRRKIADHLVSAQQNAALLTTFNECDMSSVMQLRKELQEDFIAKYEVKIGFMSIFIKAVVDALKEVEQINARIDGTDLIRNHFFDIGVAVGSKKGLVVPVIRDCDNKSFAQIEKDIAEYASRANQGKLAIADLQGGVFTISNGGIYGSMLSTPIINPPQSAILGMHNIIERPVAVEGKVVIRPMMYLALSYDHRIVDGKEAVTFLRRVKDCVENPARLLVGA